MEGRRLKPGPLSTNASLVPNIRERIHLCSLQRGEVGRPKSHDRKHECDHQVRPRIDSADLEEQTAQEVDPRRAPTRALARYRPDQTGPLAQQALAVAMGRRPREQQPRIS